MTKLWLFIFSFTLLLGCAACSQEEVSHKDNATSVERLESRAMNDEPSPEVAEEDMVASLDQFAREALQAVSQQKHRESELSSVNELENLSEADRQAFQDMVADESADSVEQHIATEVEQVKADKNIEQILTDIELNE